MAINVPMPDLPLKGLNQAIATGGNLFAQMMNPVIQRENMERQWRQHLDSLALQKEQMAHARRNDDLQRLILQEQLMKLQHSNDPTYEFNQFKNLMGMFGGGEQMPQMPTQESGEGMGMFTPEGLMSAQQEPVSEPTSGFDMSALKSNPILRGYFKSKFGFDPLAQAPQTPEEKQASALDLFKKKEAIKAQSKGGSAPTNAVLTQNQQALQGIDTVLPMLDELIKSKDIPGIFDFSPGKKAAYNAKTSSMIDTLVAAQSLPKVQASIDLVEEQIRRKSGESVKDYQKRLGDLKSDLIKRRQRAKGVIENRQINTKAPEDLSQMSEDELIKIAGGS